MEVEVFVERPQECAQLFFRLERRGEPALAVYGAVCYNVKKPFFPRSILFREICKACYDTFYEEDAL